MGCGTKIRISRVWTTNKHVTLFLPFRALGSTNSSFPTKLGQHSKIKKDTNIWRQPLKVLYGFTFTLVHLENFFFYKFNKMKSGSYLPKILKKNVFWCIILHKRCCLYHILHKEMLHTKMDYISITKNVSHCVHIQSPSNAFLLQWRHVWTEPLLDTCVQLNTEIYLWTCVW